MSYQSYRQCFVTNSPALLAEGQTVDNLAIGQVGFLDAKTYKGVSLPTYAKNKALYAVWGTPDVNLGDFGGVPNENEYSKIIKGKKIKRVRAAKASRGQTPLYTVGWSGDSLDTNSLFANIGETKVLYVKLTGTIIDRLYSTQGIIKQLVFEPACVTDCEDLCGPVDPRTISAQLMKQFNEDKDLNKFIKVKELITGTNIPVATTTTCYRFALSLCDTGDDIALGLVQAKYPTDSIARISRVGAISKYQVTRFVNTAPASFTTSNMSVPDCPTCPAGSTLVPVGYTYTINLVAGAALPTPVGTLVTNTLLHTEDGRDTRQVTYSAEQTNPAFVFIGETRNICQLTPATFTWAADGTGLRQAATYTLVIADDECGTNRLLDIQAAYPDLVVTVSNAAAAGCVHTYSTTVNSNCYEVGCGIEEIKFTAPAMFEGASWERTIPALVGTDIKTGIQIEGGFFSNTTDECTFDSFSYENDVVHVQISNYDPNFNASPCTDDWKVKQIRQAAFPQGHGESIKRREQMSKAYDRRHRNFDAAVRGVQGYSLQADANKFYDEYVIEFDFDYNTPGGWTQKNTDQYSLFIYVPEGQGKALENLLNSYTLSAGLDEDAVSI